MSIAAADLVPYLSANVPTDDVSTSGGAIDTLRRPDFTQLSATDIVEVLSSSGSDTTPTVTITGRRSSGIVASEVLTLNGTTAVASATAFERILKVELSTTCVGTITVRKQTGAVTVRQIPIGERGFMSVIQRLASDPSSIKNFYVKFFWKNTHATLALTQSVVKENADPAARITHALAASLDDSGSVANRVTSPGLTFDNSDKNVPNSQNLTNGSAIGVWLNLNLPVSDPANKTTYTSELTGQTI